VSFLLGAAAQFGGGLLADRFSLKKLIMIGLSVEVPVLLLAAQAWDWPLFGLSIVMVVFTLGLQPVMDCLIAHYVPAAWHARAYGARFLVAIVVGSAAVPVVGWVFDTTGGFGWLFAGLAAVAAIGVSMAATLPRDRAANDPVAEAMI
jgi:MFS family permease